MEGGGVSEKSCLTLFINADLPMTKVTRLMAVRAMILLPQAHGRIMCMVARI